jgi:tetratricopeptide (TPR) repeat protein
VKYIPNIIPQGKKIDVSLYIKESPKAKQPKLNIGLEFLGGLFIFIGFVFFFSKFLIGILFVLAGFSFVSGTRKIIEEILQFTFTRKLQNYFVGILFVIGLPVNSYYNSQQEALLVKQQYEQRQSAIRDSIQRIENEKQRIADEKDRLALLDTINIHLGKARSYIDKKNYNKAILEYSIAQEYLPSNKDIKYERALCYKKMKSYDEAITSFESLQGYNNAQFQIAQCYEGKGEKRSAIALYKQLGEAGNKKATARYEKLNPIKKHLSYYQTVCCDGTFSPSNAKGRGACSHHGGVCDWDYPIYDEYREYE